MTEKTPVLRCPCGKGPCICPKSSSTARSK